MTIRDLYDVYASSFDDDIAILHNPDPQEAANNTLEPTPEQAAINAVLKRLSEETTENDAQIIQELHLLRYRQPEVFTPAASLMLDIYMQTVSSIELPFIQGIINDELNSQLAA